MSDTGIFRLLNQVIGHRRALSYGLRSGMVLLLMVLSGTMVAEYLTKARDTPVQATLETHISVPKTKHYVLDIPPDFRHTIKAIQTVERSGKLRRRSTLIKVLIDLGAHPDDAYLALNAIYDANLLDPRRLQAGLPVTAHFEVNTNTLISVSVRPDKDQRIFSKRLANGAYFSAALKTRLLPSQKRIATHITTNLYDAALKAGAEDQQVVDFAQIFAFDIDFQREIHPGDQFEIIYESFVDERGQPVRSGEVLFAALTGKTLSRAYYRHVPEDDKVPDYFTRDGKAATRFLMKTPINGARLSSSFGRRRHPISGYTRLHKGTDFAAPSGTPIYAAGNGIVEKASRYGGYGKYVRIQHTNGYETAYAHMSRYGPNIRKGKRVRQGDIIGYVGSTGASTGPHLHYEVLIHGKHVNAMTLKLPTGRILDGALFNTFRETRAYIDNIRHNLGADLEVATFSHGREQALP